MSGTSVALSLATRFAGASLLLFSPCVFAIPAATFVKGSDGPASHQYRNPSTVVVTADPAFTANRALFLQARSYILQATARPAPGWKAVHAQYIDSGGKSVLIPLNGATAPVSFQVPLDLSSKSGGTSLLRVLFVTQRLQPGGIVPEYQDTIDVAGQVFTEAAFWALDTDGNGLGDAWETQHFGKVGNNPNADPDGDGFSNLQEYRNGTNPFGYDKPMFTIVAGNNRGGLPNAVLNPPLTVRLTAPNGQPQSGFPVNFAILSGGGTLQSIQATTDSDGIAKATLKLPSTVGAVVTIRARTTISSVPHDLLFTATVGDPTLAPAAPSRPSVTMQADDVEAVLEWEDRSHNETAFYVERSLDNRTWIRRATLAANTTNYTDTGLIPGTLYLYRIVAHNNAP